MKIPVSELRKLTELLFAHLEQNGHQVVNVPHDYYWYIPTEQRYEPYQEPKELTLGQLTDDWEELQKILHGKSDPVNYAFVWLSALLRALGETTPE